MSAPVGAAQVLPLQDWRAMSTCMICNGSM
jgi:hypothetical protein